MKYEFKFKFIGNISDCIVNVKEGETIILELTSDPLNANDNVEFSATSYSDYFSFSKIDNKHVSITGIADHTSINLTATTAGGKTATIGIVVINP